MIFYKKTYLEDRKEGTFLRRVSSRIRGEEISRYLGASLKANIYIKGCRHESVKDGDYVDVLDDLWMTDWLKNRPKVKVIAMSLAHYDWLKSQLPNDIVYIPHHHMNFERAIRTRKKITTYGYIGSRNSFDDKLRKLDNLITLFEYKTRQDNIDFYKKIDIQVIGDIRDVPYYHPTKIINAMSFGIPTIAPKKMGYREVEGFYYHSVDELKNGWDAERLIKEAEKYHISKIAELYKKL